MAGLQQEENVVGAHLLSVANALAVEGPWPLADVSRRLFRSTSVPDALVHQNPVTKLPRIAVEAEKARVVDPFWFESPWVIVDLETTGMSPGSGASVTEVAAWRVQGGEVLERFVRFVHPGHPIPRFITGITGIDDAMVEGAPPWSQVVRELADFMGDDPWMAHNQSFDAKFIDVGLSLADAEPPPGLRICTLKLSRRLLKGGRHNLGAMVERLGVAAQPCHRAEADVAATHQVVLALLMRLPVRYRSWDMLAQWLDGSRRRVSASS